jgi:Disaggregatase related repeat
MKTLLITAVLVLFACGSAHAVTATIGNNTGNTYSGVSDTRLQQDIPTSNFSSSTALDVDKFGAGGHANTLIKFTGLSNITGPVTVTSATIRLRLNGSDGGGASYTIGVRRLLRDWQNAQATWNVYSTGNSWTTAGGLSNGNDRSATLSASQSVPGNGTGSYYSFTGSQLATDVQNIINGTASNFGWILEREDAGDDSLYRVFNSSESSDGQRPELNITYTVGGGTIVRHRRVVP